MDMIITIILSPLGNRLLISMFVIVLKHDLFSGKRKSILCWRWCYWMCPVYT